MTAMLMRSKLFVPGSRPELFAKALAGEADGISIDLEDSVQESRKTEARATAADVLRTIASGPTGKVLIVRVNGISTPHTRADSPPPRLIGSQSTTHHPSPGRLQNGRRPTGPSAPVTTTISPMG